MDLGKKAHATKTSPKHGTVGQGERSSVKKRDSIPSEERVLDAAVEFTFPASDPISVDHSFRAASEQDSNDAHEVEDFRPGAPRQRIKRPTR